MAKIDDFWKIEKVDIGQRNVDCSEKYESHLPELRRRLAHRTTFMTICMDERCGMVADPLDLLPNEAIVMASGGGRISPEDFDRIYGVKVQHSIQARRQTAIYLITHECAGYPKKGCAAFKSDVPVQKAYFAELQQALKKLYPEAFVHTLMHDTSTNRLLAIDTDNRDDHLAKVLANDKNLLETEQEELGHAGYGVYIGDAYRSWVKENNRYLRLSSLDPNLVADLKLAIVVVTEHSSIDLSTHPVVIHLDNPIYPDSKLSGACRRNMEEALTEVMAEPKINKMIDDGLIRIIKTETEIGSQRGFTVG